MSTPQDRGRSWEREVAELVEGRLQPGSGNRVEAQLDVRSGLLLVECKHTDAASFSLSTKVWDAVREASTGSSTASYAQTILALRLGASGHRLGVVDLDDLVSWIREPPALLPAMHSSELRRLARTPTILR